MKMSKLLSSTLMLGALLFGAGKAAAQGGIAPSQQLGIGVFAGDGAGASIQYAFTPAVQLGLGLGLAGRGGTTSYGLDIYGRFLFEGIVNPFVQAGFRRGSTSSEVGNVTTTVNSTHIYGGLGLEYFFTRNVGVYGLVDVLTLDLDADNDAVGYGLNGGRIGLEWFFNP